jgi:hypothetical protein
MKGVNPLEKNTHYNLINLFHPVDWLLGSAASSQSNDGERNQF